MVGRRVLGRRAQPSSHATAYAESSPFAIAPSHLSRPSRLSRAKMWKRLLLVRRVPPFDGRPGPRRGGKFRSVDVSTMFEAPEQNARIMSGRCNYATVAASRDFDCPRYDQR